VVLPKCASAPRFSANAQNFNSEMNKPDPSHPRLYGRRKGRPLRVRKSRLMEELLPKVKIALPAKPPLDPKDSFVSKPEEIWLEIGFGGGEHLVAQAMAHPDVGFIGCEPFVNGVASLLDHIDREKLNNVRVFADDARLLLDALPDGLVARCFVLFPDPWPKARHAERRFICPENLARLARILRTGAELRLATDDPQLAEWMTDSMDAARQFKRMCRSPAPLEGWITTRYEQKAIKAGRKPVYFSYERN
jgi:tRNA (guanine-N7-)-methyltransferase